MLRSRELDVLCLRQERPTLLNERRFDAVDSVMWTQVHVNIRKQISRFMVAQNDHNMMKRLDGHMPFGSGRYLMYMTRQATVRSSRAPIQLDLVHHQAIEISAMASTRIDLTDAGRQYNNKRVCPDLASRFPIGMLTLT